MRDRLGLLLESLSPARRTRIADIGANPINVPPYRDLLAADCAEVWGFEPAEDAYEALKQQKDSAHETYLPYAVGDGTAGTLHICKSGGFTSLLPPDKATLGYLGRWHRLMQVVEKRPVQTRRLDDLDEVPRIDLLKIDVQGGELDVFRGAPDRLSEAVAVITEVAFVPLYDGQPLLDAQMRELAEQGFALHKFLHMTARPLLGADGGQLVRRMHRNQLIDGDAVFIRDMRRPEAFSDEQLKHLAILADSAFSSFDLTLRCLGVLQDRGAVTEAAVARYTASVPGMRRAQILETAGELG